MSPHVLLLVCWSVGRQSFTWSVGISWFWEMTRALHFHAPLKVVILISILQMKIIMYSVWCMSKNSTYILIWSNDIRKNIFFWVWQVFKQNIWKSVCTFFVKHVWWPSLHFLNDGNRTFFSRQKGRIHMHWSARKTMPFYSFECKDNVLTIIPPQPPHHPLLILIWYSFEIVWRWFPG